MTAESRAPSRSSLVRWLLLGMLAAGGCAGTGPDDLRMARYRPDVRDRQPWAWDAVMFAATNQVEGRHAALTEILHETEPATDRAAEDGGSTLRVLQPGDRVAIALRGIPQPEDLQNVIDGRGRITMPFIGMVNVSGKTTSDVERMLEQAYVEGGYFRKINVIVLAQETRYFVRGEVRQQGRFPLSGELTLMQAIATAGGFTDYARRSDIRVTRQNDVLRFDARRIEDQREPDPVLEPGDIIVVPRRVFLP